jgi:hypothetical protein
MTSVDGLARLGVSEPLSGTVVSLGVVEVAVFGYPLVSAFPSSCIDSLKAACPTMYLMG